MLYVAFLALAAFTLVNIHIERKTRMNVQVLLDKVTAQTTVMESAEALLATLSQEVKDAGTDPVKLQAISDALDANTAGLAAAVTANTPAPAIEPTRVEPVPADPTTVAEPVPADPAPADPTPADPTPAVDPAPAPVEEPPAVV